MSFLDNYEDVAARIQRFWATYPNGKIHTSIKAIDIEKGFILIECRVFRNYEDQEPAGIDYAFGNVNTYNVQMKKWFIEDCLTSAYGRVIGLLTPSEHARPTSQDMQKVEASYADPWSVKAASEGIPTMATAIAEIQQGLGGELPAAPPRCAHGTMVWAEGTSAKTGKAWGAYRCTEKSKASQCDPVWHVLTSEGKWKPQL